MAKESIHQLSEIIDLIGGGTPKTSIPDYWDGDIPWLSVVDFNNGRKFVFDTEKKITTEGLNNSSTKLLDKGDIIISARGTVGVISVLGIPMAFNQSCYGIKAKKDLSINGYIYYLLKAAVSNFLQIAHGGVFDTITRDTFKEIEVLLPPLPEQKAIASDKIDLLHRQNKPLEAMAETLFRQWFVEGARDDWEKGKVKDIVDVLSGFAFKSSVFVEAGTYRLITIKAVQDGYLEVNSAVQIEDVPSQTPDYCFLEHGDILLSLTGNVGRCCMVDTEKLLLNQRVAKLRAINKRDWAFVYVMFRQQSMRQALEDMGKGTAQSNLSPVEMSNMAMQMPPSDLLEKFSVKTTPVLKKVHANKIQIKALQSLRDTLLPKLMSGEVRVEYEH